MLPEDALKDLLSQKLNDREKALICLAVEPVGAREIKEITNIAFAAGWRQVKKKNLSSIYSRADGLATRTTGGWELTSEGSHFVAKLAGPLMNSPIPMVALALRAHLVAISDSDTQSFVEEAIVCFETRQFRAAVVLSWVGAVSVLQNHVVNHELTDFNTEVTKRNPKWRPAKSADDLGRMKEDTFLDILQATTVVGKSVKQELKKALTLRNGCGHPNSLKLAEHKVSAHVEDLILNVFAVF